ncbi:MULTISPECIES: hypothetical protein [unclassified Variovorax]|uniref:hypothetical protein n=1 Tax=unclassified Variovorax TaxID=663243 RepID=UPI003ECFE81A
MRTFICGLLLLPLICIAESTSTANSATASLGFRVIVPVEYRVLQVTRVRDGYEYRIWTNAKSVVINGREYRFGRVGETRLTVPESPNELFIVHGL